MSDFTYLLRVRYSECDAQKVVFNGKYAEFIDVAATEFTRVIWGNYNDILKMGVDNQVVNLTVSWQAPARFDDVLAITVKLGRIGNSSYTLVFDITNYASGAKIATAETVYVMVDAKEFSKKSIPNELKDQLEKGAGGAVINHAGV